MRGQLQGVLHERVTGSTLQVEILQITFKRI